jgi:hypothetical protein
MIKEKLCKKCNINKELDNFYKHSGYKDGLRPLCIECHKGDVDKYRTPEKNRMYVNKFWKTPHGIKYKKQYFQKFYDIYGHSYITYYNNLSILHRMAGNLRTCTRIYMRQSGYKNGSRINKIIGCTPDELRLYIESKFQPGMTWENHGNGLNSWNLDHIIPLSSAKSKKELIKLGHYTNIQPLWYTENKQKFNKIFDAAL